MFISKVNGCLKSESHEEGREKTQEAKKKAKMSFTSLKT